MADVNFTENSILPGANAQKQRGTFGGTITQGMPVYLIAASNKWGIGHCETSAATAAIVGIALTSGVDGQPGIIQTAGNLTCDGVTAGQTYILSAAGGVCPITDVTTNDYVTIIGVATTTTNILLGILPSATKHA
jgi:hypothetical protein